MQNVTASVLVWQLKADVPYWLHAVQKVANVSACKQKGAVLETIKSSTEVSYLFTQGKRVHTPFLTFIVLHHEKQHGQGGRVAFVAGKKLGNAVWRNRAKRRMRALCRDLGGPWENVDVVFLAKRQTTQVKYSKVLKACETALTEAGLQSSDKVVRWKS